jgi:hypothetical protein
MRRRRRQWNEAPVKTGVHVLPDDLDEIARSANRTIPVVQRGLRVFDDRLSDALPAVFAEQLSSTPGDGLTFGSAVARLLVLHELKKCGALSYDEFSGLKAQLLGL